MYGLQSNEHASSSYSKDSVPLRWPLNIANAWHSVLVSPLAYGAQHSPGANDPRSAWQQSMPAAWSNVIMARDTLWPLSMRLDRSACYQLRGLICDAVSCDARSAGYEAAQSHLPVPDIIREPTKSGIV